MVGDFSRRAALASTAGLAAFSMLDLSQAKAMSSMAPLRIGVLADLTGPLAVHGQRAFDGIQFQVKALNGDHSAPMIEIISADTASDEAAPAKAMASLLFQGVHTVINTAGPGGAAALEMADAACTPIVNPGMGPTPKGMYAFQTGPDLGLVLNQAMREAKAAGATAGVLILDKLATPEVTELINSAAGGQGVTIDPPPVELPVTAADAKDAVAKVLEKKPASLVLVLLPPFDGMAVRDARAAGFTGPIIGTPATTDPGMQGAAAAAADGVKAITPWLPAATKAPEATRNLVTMQMFAEKFTAKTGRPSAQVGFGADALYLLHLAFLGHRDRKLAQEQLESMCAIGVTGVYNMKPDNHAGVDEDALTVLVSQEGSWIPAEPPAEPPPSEPPPSPSAPPSASPSASPSPSTPPSASPSPSTPPSPPPSPEPPPAP